MGIIMKHFHVGQSMVLAALLFCGCSSARASKGLVSGPAPAGQESGLRTVPSEALQRADFVSTWSEYLSKKSSLGFNVFSPAPGAEPLVMTRSEYKEWRKDRGDAWNNSLGSFGRQPPMILAAGPRLELSLRELLVFRVPDKMIEEIQIRGSAVQAYWGLDQSQRNPANRGKQVDPVSELYLIGKAAGSAMLELSLSDGKRRQIKLSVIPTPK